ncbi:MAG: Maf family protein [Bacillota bacterium]|nr:Maf family protein [Bacillota bacterium]
MRLVLASSSPRRRALLEALGLPFEVVPPGVDEPRRPGLPPERLVEELSLRKALAVARRLAGEGGTAAPAAPAAGAATWILGSDTVVVLDGEILGKPSGPAEAVRMLERLAGRTHVVYSGIALVPLAARGTAPEERARVAHQRTEVRLRALRPGEAERYVATGEPLDKAGAYAAQGRGAVLIEWIRGDYTNVVGLPVPLLLRTLEALERGGG